MISAGIDVSVSVTTDGGGPIVTSKSTTKIPTAWTATETPIAPPNRRCRQQMGQPKKARPDGSTTRSHPRGVASAAPVQSVSPASWGWCAGNS